MNSETKEKILFAVAIALIAAAIFTAPREKSGGLDVATPPERFQCNINPKLIIDTPAATRLACAFRGSPGPACASIGPGWIRMPDESVGWDKHTRKAVLRHEVGHNCGWPKHHPR